MDADKVKRRLYVCLHCPKRKLWHINQKYRMVGHIYKQHLPMDNAPYYCNLCLFRSTTHEALENHLTSYRRHTLALTSIRGPVDERKYLVVNSNPTILVEGVDYRVATQEEVINRCPSRVEAEVEDPLVDLDEVIGAGDADNSSGLINVQLTPEVLARLLGQQPGTVGAQAGARVPIYDPLQPAYVPARKVGYRSAFKDIGPQNDGLARTHGLPFTQTSQEMYVASTLDITVPTLPTVTYTPTAPQYFPTSTTTVSRVTPVLQLPPVGGVPMTSGLDCDATADTPLDNRVVRALSTLSTPELNTKSTFGRTPVRSVEDIMGQLLPGDDVGYGFSPIPQEQKAEPVHREVQTDPCNKDSQGGAVASALVHLEKVIKVGFGKLVAATDWNSRAIRNLDNTLNKVADSMARMERSMERLVQEKRRSSRRSPSQETLAKRPRTSGKENSKPEKKGDRPKK